MTEKTDNFIKTIYRRWKQDLPKIGQAHPDEEAVANFIEKRLPKEEAQEIKTHLISCESCLEKFIISSSLEASRVKDIPNEMLVKVKNLMLPLDSGLIFEIIIRLKDKMLEIINTTGDVLVGQEFVPASVLRSRALDDFKDEVRILKDIKDLRIEVKIENKVKDFNLIVLVSRKDTHKLIKDLRITLLRDDYELESYISGISAVTFEHVQLGKYAIEINNIEQRIAAVSLDIKI